MYYKMNGGRRPTRGKGRKTKQTEAQEALISKNGFSGRHE